MKGAVKEVAEATGSGYGEEIARLTAAEDLIGPALALARGHPGKVPTDTAMGTTTATRT